MGDSGVSKKDAMYAQLAESLHILNKNFTALRQNLETTQRQTTAIQQLTLSHASLFIASQNVLQHAGPPTSNLTAANPTEND
ncbi:hypothetical protein IWQ62_005620 [Dispira parvispora]|uniref:Uncharacterized protein n=1 Tax=Dispira parvispora TaxID=1520584 RepID=A0A9W8ALW2_9FUNG|nr:hypothetical protein IWQ62_005620 [Dispira parvispora]